MSLSFKFQTGAPFYKAGACDMQLRLLNGVIFVTAVCQKRGDA